MKEIVMNATHAQKVDFICSSFRKGSGKKFTKTELNKYPESALDSICDKYADKFEEFLNTPKVKLQKFYVECIADNKEVTYEVSTVNEQTCIDEFKSDGIEVTKIVPAKGHHICKYCGSIAEGTYKDLLCDTCKDVFGHSLFSEL